MKLSPSVLIITNLDDFAADYLILKLMENEISYLRVNSEDISNWEITYSPSMGISLKFKDSNYNLSSVRGVYFRRAPTIFNDFLNTKNSSFLWRESKEFFEGIYLTISANWINPIFETYKAERKLNQLSVAKNIGFRIPQSLVTNNPVELKKFISEKKSIIKPISHGLQISENSIFSIYTHNIDKDLEFKLDELFETPIYVQERIQNKYDIRATVVGNEIFPVGIRKDNDNEIDWRKPEITKDYQIIELPSSVSDKCFEINKIFGLSYSAIDLILSDNGDYTFLEINPAGEWVWLEKELGIPISQKLIEELTK